MCVCCKGCRLVVLVDRADNEASFRRKSKADSGAKSQAQLEGPVETAALWTLAGAGAVVAPQWATSFGFSADFALKLFDGLANKKVRRAGKLLRQPSSTSAWSLFSFVFPSSFSLP